MALLPGQLTLVLSLELFSSPFNRFCFVRRQENHPVVFARRNGRTQPPLPLPSAPRPLTYTLGAVARQFHSTPCQTFWSETPEQCMCDFPTRFTFI